MDSETARGRLIVALDVPTVNEASDLFDHLGDSVSFYKVGLELVMDGGLNFVRTLKERGKKVFLDVKFLPLRGFSVLNL